MILDCSLREGRALSLAGRRLHNEAVSHVVAALLLIAVTVAAAVLLYVFAIGVIGNLSTGVGQQIADQVTMVSYSFPVGGPLSITVKNVGSSSVDLSKADFFINGVSATPGTGCVLILAIGASCTTSISLTDGYAGLASGVSYPVKIVTANGAIFSYSVIYGGSG
jgi:flagellin-like protein